MEYVEMKNSVFFDTFLKFVIAASKEDQKTQFGAHIDDLQVEMLQSWNGEVAIGTKMTLNRPKIEVKQESNHAVSLNIVGADGVDIKDLHFLAENHLIDANQTSIRVRSGNTMLILRG